MDEICSAILNKLCEVSGVGNFIILEEDELFECFPEGVEKTRTVLDAALKKLRSGGLIEVRYSRGDLFCLAPLKKPEASTPSTQIKIEPIPKKIYTIVVAAIILCSFLGAFAGALVAGLF